MEEWLHKRTYQMNTTLMNYNGTLIHHRDEMVSLTDMWRANGSDNSRRPAAWLRSADAQRFLDALKLGTNVSVLHTAFVRTVRGGSQPGTFAHWQLALAYAKYLSPEFHLWCNTVIREWIEGGKLSKASVEPKQEELHLPPPAFDSNVVMKSDLKILCEWIGNRLKQHEERQRASLLSEVKGMIAEIWHAKSSLRKDLTDPQRLADRGLLMLPAPTPDTTYITATEICWRVIPEDELQKDLPGIVGKRILSHARRHMWPQGETPIRSRRDRPMPTYPVSRVQEWLDSGGADFIREENIRRLMVSAQAEGVIPFVRAASSQK